MTSAAGERVVIGVFVVALVVYAAMALIAHRWVSGAAAPGVAVLLALRHPRMRQGDLDTHFVEALLKGGASEALAPLAASGARPPAR